MEGKEGMITIRLKARQVALTAAIVLTLGIGVVIGTIVSGRVGAELNQGASATPLAIPSPVQLSSTFALIAEKVEPAVVNISTSTVTSSRTRRRAPQDPMEDFFERYFGFQDPGPRRETSLGSGVIVDKSGYILTNNHVVERATKIQVKLYEDPTQYAAKVIGVDRETDLAVIKIDANKALPVARLGNSDAAKVGDWVLAFGSPFQLEATVTAGIISARDRGNVGEQFQRFLQTDAAINPGNSGGPLVNMAGEVIGINTAIMTATRGFDGVGFALPSNTAINVYNDIIKKGRVTRGSIGVTFTEANSSNPVMLRQMGVPHGIYIEDVEPGSPADKAGLKPGDVITEVNGKPVKSGTDLVNPIAATPVGEKVRLKYVRDRKAYEVTATVEDRAKIFPARAGNLEEDSEPSGPSELGLRIDELTPEQARRLGIDRSAHDLGVVVTQVEAGSFADDLGFRRGDFLTEINGQRVGSASDFRRLVAQLKPGQEVLFRVLRRRQDRDGFLNIPLAGIVPKPQD
jgi:serine protease Do